MKHSVKIMILFLTLCMAVTLCACGMSEAVKTNNTENRDAATSGYDSDVYEAAVQAVRDEIIGVIETGMEDFDENAHSELPWYTAILMRIPGNRYYEAFNDFDGNGVPEMIVGVGDENNRTPIAIYAFDGKAMRYLCKEAPLGERAFLSYKDGLFIVRGSGGAASGVLTIYKIAENGWDTEIVDIISYEFSDAEHVNYQSERGNISNDELLSKGLLDITGFDIEPDWKCFYPIGNE